MSNKLIVYRSDPRELSVGSIMYPNFSEAPPINKEEQRVEKAIMKLNHELTKHRTQALYTWLSKSFFERQQTSSLRHLSNLRGKYFYELEVDKSDILFVGNLDVYSEAKALINSPERFVETVEQYAMGCDLGNTSERIEVLVSKAKVLKRYDKK